MPNKKVGCIFVTRHLQHFLEEYPPPSHKQAFLVIYHMLSLLDKCLYDNPKEHTHCMSLDTEYVNIVEICNTFEHRLKHISYYLGCTHYSPGYPRWQS